MKVVVCTEYSPSYQEIADITLPVMEEYCQKHRYGFEALKIPDNDFAYRKHDYFSYLLSTDIDVIFYIDVDCLITNYNYRVEDFIDDDHDFFITKDANEVNGGSMILKNTGRGRWINELILSKRGLYENEQNVINAFIHSPQFNQFIKILTHPSINSYRYDFYQEFPNVRGREEGHWHPGDFILHVPALELSKRAAILKTTEIIK